MLAACKLREGLKSEETKSAKDCCPISVPYICLIGTFVGLPSWTRHSMNLVDYQYNLSRYAASLLKATFTEALDKRESHQLAASYYERQFKFDDPYSQLTILFVVYLLDYLLDSACKGMQRRLWTESGLAGFKKGTFRSRSSGLWRGRRSNWKWI